MSDSWHLLDSGLGEPAFNMALDEVLLAAASEIGRPVLRFYGWAEPAATFGYFQKYAEIERTTELRRLIRRPTGGGLVPHDHDWTYSVSIPAGDEWYLLKAQRSYKRVHEWVCAAFARMGIPMELAAQPRSLAPGQCFEGYELDDALWQGRKVAGAAQRRTKQGLLIQGSVQPPPAGLDRGRWQRAMGEVASRAMVEWTPDEALIAQANELAEKKYTQDTYNRKR